MNIKQWMKKLKDKPKAIFGFRKIYNSLCRPCQKKVYNNPKLDLDDYCDKCRAKVKPLLLKLYGGLK